MLVLLMTAVTGAWADGERTSHWPDFSPENYEKNNTLVAGIMIDGVIITADYDGWDQLEVAPFIGDECRCVHGESASYLYNGYVQEYGDPFPVLDGMLIFYNGEGGDEVTFKMYNHATGVEYTACDVTYLGDPITIKTGDEHMEGWDDPENPVFLNFTTPEPAAPAAYTVSMKESTEDATNWTIAPAEATTTGVAAGTTVTATYSGTKKVKSVKAVKKAAANPNAYMKWDNTKKELVEAEIPAGATTETNADTNVEWAAGTYVVEGDVTINGNITLGGNVDLIIKDGAKLTVNGRIHGSSSKYNLSIYGQANQSGQLVVNNPSNDAIVSITTLEVHSCQVTASSSGNNRGGFYGIVTFNVYGGSVDAENTGATSGYGIYLSSSGSMNIYGGDVKAVGKGDNSTYSYGITGSSSITVTVYGGKLWAENADQKAIKNNITLAKGAGFTGKTETSDNGTSWTDLTTEGTPDAKYVRVGY